MNTSVALPSGTEVGGLVIQRVLGRGGFGIVYEALDPDLDRKVALKEFFLSHYARRSGLDVLPTDAQAAETFDQGKARFLREARLLAMLHERAPAQTRSLVIVHRVLQAHQTAYMVMKLYQGPTLRAHVRQDPAAVTQSWLTQVMVGTLDALELLHSLPGENLVHRDVSPDNIILQSGDTPVLLDFGATRGMAGELTAVIVKAGYSPIEQYTDLHPMGPWTDLYALCGTAYYAMSGHSPGDAVDRLAGAPYISAATRGAGRFSAEFLAVLDRGLAVLPQDRFQSVAEMRAALLRAAPASPALADGSSGVVAATEVGGTQAAGTTTNPADPDATLLRPLPNAVHATAGEASGAVAQTPSPTIAPLPTQAADPTVTRAPAPAAARAPVSAPAPAAAPVLAPAPAPARRSRSALWGLALAGLGLGAVAFWLVSRPSPPTEAPGRVAVPAAQCAAGANDWPCALETLGRLAPAVAGQSFEVAPRTVKVGERLSARFVSPQSGYLYVFSVDEPQAPTATLLFPRADDLEHRVQAGVALTLPRPPLWDIVVQPPTGRSWLVAVVMAQPVAAWAPAAFQPVRLAEVTAGLQSTSPWQAFGLPACVDNTACVAPQALLAVEFEIR